MTFISSTYIFIEPLIELYVAIQTSPAVSNVIHEQIDHLFCVNELSMVYVF